MLCARSSAADIPQSEAGAPCPHQIGTDSIALQGVPHGSESVVCMSEVLLCLCAFRFVFLRRKKVRVVCGVFVICDCVRE